MVENQLRMYSGQSWMQECGFVLNSKSLQAERVLGCALNRRMGTDVVGNWSREKSCPGVLMAVETGNKDQSEELEEGDGYRIVNKNTFFFFLPFVLLPCPAIVFMNCFLIRLFQLPLWRLYHLSTAFMEFILIFVRIINFAMKILVCVLWCTFL